jgi:hypothetical protein
MQPEQEGKKDADRINGFGPLCGRLRASFRRDPGQSQPSDSSRGDIEIETLSTKLWLVSGGDVLVEIRVTGIALRLEGREVETTGLKAILDQTERRLAELERRMAELEEGQRTESR